MPSAKGIFSMVDKVVGQIFNPSLSKAKQPRTTSGPTFMDTLRNEFDRVSSQLKETTIAGVFSITPPVEPQAIPSLDIPPQNIV